MLNNEEKRMIEIACEQMNKIMDENIEIAEKSIVEEESKIEKAKFNIECWRAKIKDSKNAKPKLVDISRKVWNLK